MIPRYLGPLVSIDPMHIGTYALLATFKQSNGEQSQAIYTIPIPKSNAHKENMHAWLNKGQMTEEK